ncbi:MAG: hypothetical protein BGN97_03645 [Microbacterium sp. 69-10]|nr:MAG: hypothetical protein BGN97_03645 [Microbacterium sp. 69-10]
MALKDVLKTPPASTTGYRSRIEVWRDGLDDADRKAFDAAVRNPQWTGAALARVVKAEGLNIGESAMRDYRAKVSAT